MDAAAVGGAFLSAFLQVLFERLASKHVVDFIHGRDLDKEFKKLENSLTSINAFLNDAETKQYTNEAVKNWLDDLRDVAYDAEDLIDVVATKALQMNLKAESSQTISNLAAPSVSFIISLLSKMESDIRAMFPDPKIKSNIKRITERFDELAQDVLKLDLVKIAFGSSSSSSVFRETSSVVDESSIYGRKDDERKIIELLLKEESSSTSHNNKFSVIPIVSMGGVGKTTLAQLVYNSNWVQNHYNMRAWVCVSDKFDIKKITKAILESLTSSTCQVNESMDSLQVKVKESLSGKKFLIILDDVWNQNYNDWHRLQTPFGVGATGSAIIVTTRDRQVALNMGTVNPYDLELLSEDDCWRLFVHHAFGILSVDAKPDLQTKTKRKGTRPDLVIIGKEIAKKCKGLPLAAKSLGGLLRSKEELEWKNVLYSKIWDLPEDESDILPVLKLSYYYLPSHLKRCFTYCSIFPKDYEFEEEKVVLLWMAEGFLQQPNEKMKLEDFGRKCFRELLSKSFFQPSSLRNWCFVMHDLMRDIALWAAGKTCFRLEDSWDMSSQCMKARHLSCIMAKDDNEVRKFEKLYGVQFLRTFLQLDIWCQIESLSSDLFFKMKFLRVLSLPGSDITDLPSWIGNLEHLRYIDISDSNIKSIPESVCTLYNLQTLLLKSCSNLTKLHEKLQNLINLRHLDISNSLDWMEAMPPQIGQLTSLRKLSNFVVGKDSGCGIEELGNLQHLEGTLQISKLNNVIDAEQAKAANLSDKKGLNVLEMKWCSKFDNPRNERVENEVLDKLRPPHEKLEELRILYYGGVSFPTWVGEATFSSMVLLKLEGCEKCTHLPPLGQLPLLKDVFIERMNGVVTVGREFYGKGYSNPFPSLEKLCFKDMKEWRVWEIEDCPSLTSSSSSSSRGEFPATLKRLDIHKCQKLESIGGRFHSNPFLDEIRINSCESLKYLPENLHNLTRLSTLYILNCPSLVRFPDGGLPGNLRNFTIAECEKLEALPNRMHDLTSLQSLTIRYCPGIVSFFPLEEEEDGYPTSITELEIGGSNICKALFQWGLHKLGYLTYLSVKDGCLPDQVSFPTEAEGEVSIVLPSSLIYLSISHFPNLESLSSKGFQNLTSLQTLKIWDCPKLRSFPENGLPPSLLKLYVNDCTLLEQRCKRDQGQEWSKISHVPDIEIFDTPI